MYNVANYGRYVISYNVYVNLNELLFYIYPFCLSLQLPYSRRVSAQAFKLGKVLEWGVCVNPGGAFKGRGGGGGGV